MLAPSGQAQCWATGVSPAATTDGHLDFVPVKSADRVLTLIELLTEHRGGLTFAQLQEITGWPRSSLHGLVRTMSERHHVEFDPHSQVYRVGVRIWEAGQAFNSQIEITELSMPYLEEARDRLSETIQLAVLEGIENIYVAKVEASHPLRLASYVGARLPSYATGIGKVLLAGLSEQELDRRLADVEFVPYTGTTICSMDRLRSVLREARAQGFAMDNEEYTVGVRCYAVPVRDHSGDVTAAISTSIPSARVSDGISERALDVLGDAAGRISAKLGYRVRSPV